MVDRNLYAVLPRQLGRRISFHHLALATVLGTYVLMVLGAYTSAIGAGLSCPDWPSCYGTAVPFLHPELVSDAPYTALQIFAEWAHRGLAMLVGVLIVGTAVAAWRTRDRRIVVYPAVLAALLLPLQVVLGGLTVTASLEPVVVTSHQATAILILLLLTVTTVSNYLPTANRPVDG
jgi:heme A synthase